MNNAYNDSQTNLSMYYNRSSSSNEPLGPSNTNGNANNPGTSPRTLTVEGVSSDGAGAGASTAIPNVNPNINANIVNDIYSQLSQLTSQFNNYQNASNEKINQLSVRLDYINDSVESMKRNISDVNQQMILLLQNNQNNNFSTYYNSQNKVLEVFSKNIAKLGKEIEEIATAPMNQILHPQLQSQQRIPRNNSTSNYPEDDAFGKTLTIRSPATQGNSNPTSPFIANRFNFDINTFPQARTNPTSITPTAPTFQLQNTYATIPDPVILNSLAKPAHPNITITSSEEKPKPKKRRKAAPKQPANNTNGYMLPLPTLLPNDEEIKNGPKESPINQVQFMATLPRPGESNPIIATGQAVQDRQFFTDIDHNMDSMRPREDSGDSTNATGDSEPPSKLSDSKKSEKSDKDPTQIYRVERSLKTITDIWKEYEYGLKDKPPLKLLEHKYGTKWRNETESRTFLRRKKIYDAIEAGMRDGIEESAIIQELEEYRSYDNNGTIKKKPLLWLSTHIPEKYVR